MNRKQIFIGILFAAALLCLTAGCTANPGEQTTIPEEDGKETDPPGRTTSTVEIGSKVYTLQTFAVPERTPREEIRFRVTANGQEVGLYSDKNGWGKEVNFGYFNFDEGMPVTVEIEPLFPFRTVQALPETQGIALEQEQGKLCFTLTKPNTDMTFVFDDDYQGYVLHLFTNPVDHEAPTESEGTLLYIGPGYHDASEFGGQLRLTQDMTLYVDGGAVLNCPVLIKNASNVTVKGSGVIMMDSENSADPLYGNIVLTVNKSENVRISGVICNAHRRSNWTLHIYWSEDVTVENYRSVSPQYASTDGLDISNSRNVTVRNCFLRACDDAVSIKGLVNAASPAYAPPNENIAVSDTILWSDCNNAMVLGEESMAQYRNISFRNIDVLYSYDDRDNHTQLNERAAISIVCLHGTWFRDILWEDIRIHECERMICMTFLDSFWFGTLPGDQSYPGGFENIVLRNVSSQASNSSGISNKILLNGWGWDNIKLIDDVHFENVTIHGRKVLSLEDDCFEAVRYVGTITFE